MLVAIHTRQLLSSAVPNIHIFVIQRCVAQIRSLCPQTAPSPFELALTFMEDPATHDQYTNSEIWDGQLTLGHSLLAHHLLVYTSTCS